MLLFCNNWIIAIIWVKQRPTVKNISTTYGKSLYNDIVVRHFIRYMYAVLTTEYKQHALVYDSFETKQDGYAMARMGAVGYLL